MAHLRAHQARGMMLRQSAVVLIFSLACVAFVGASTGAHPASASAASKALGSASTANTAASLPATADAAEKHSEKTLTRKKLQKGLSILFGNRNHKPKGKPAAGEGSSGDKAGSNKPSFPYPFHKHQSRWHCNTTYHKYSNQAGISSGGSAYQLAGGSRT